MAVSLRQAAAPLSQFVLKVHSRCNLACDHCYIYEHADQGWRRQPSVIAQATVAAAARRIAEHAAGHGLDRITVVLHGGEPLLIGAASLQAALTELRDTIGSVARLSLRMQTNGILLTQTICDVLADFDVQVGVSLDGYRDANDRHRRFAHGGSSYAAVVQGLELLRQPRFRRIFSGILCTVDIRNDPVAVYEALLAQQPPRLDFLLPHATWDHPPDRPDGDDACYGHWLAATYRRWVADGRPVPIRLFDSLLSAAAGGPSGTEWVGLDPVALAVVETDGQWEQADSLKTSYDGAASTGMDVFRHTVDDVANHPGIAQRQRGLDGLCETCRSCPIVHQCGGGLYAHRYSSTNGFDNPTVYCADIQELAAVMNDHPPHPSRHSPRKATGLNPLPQVVDDVATGYGTEASMIYLVDRELTITRALVTAVGRTPGLPATAKVGWELLCRLDQADPDIVRAVLAHPYVRVWAARCLSGLRRVGRDDLGGLEPLGADLTHLNAIAGAAAILAGQDAQVPIVVRDGRVGMPTLGTVVLGKGGVGMAMLSTSVGGFTVQTDGVTVTLNPDDLRTGGESRSDWHPSRRIDMDGFSLRLEDQDPYRDCHQWSASPELTDESVRDWGRCMTAAWRMIQADVPGQLPGARTALRLLTPLQPGLPGQRRGATARHAFGAVALALAGPPHLAEMLIHELQHVKLGAILDLVDLFDPDYSGRLAVGWRTDRRPIEGALHGTYAHLALADLWRQRVRMDAPDQLHALNQFRRYRDWTSAALDTMLATGALSAAGHRFVARMALTMAGWAS